MKTKIGGGEISPHLFKLPHAEFLKSLPAGFKKMLFLDKSEIEVDEELTKLYLENGGTIIAEKDKAATAKPSTTRGRNSGSVKPCHNKT